MCRAARTLCQTSPQHCRVGQLCNNTNMLLTTANTVTGALSLLSVVEAWTWPEQLLPTNNSAIQCWERGGQTPGRVRAQGGGGGGIWQGGNCPRSIGRWIGASGWALGQLLSWTLPPHSSHSLWTGEGGSPSLGQWGCPNRAECSQAPSPASLNAAWQHFYPVSLSTIAPPPTSSFFLSFMMVLMRSLEKFSL